MITIYHNPRCSKSRAAYALLVDELSGREEVRTVEYLKTSPTLDDLKQLHALLGVPVREMIRDNEPTFAELGLDDTSLSEDALLKAVSDHPVLLQRPIVVRDSRAVIGRPPERIATLFD
ncbi:arsenate reductase (glutaredoxin) [Mycetohabitans endofungorum]|uniref:arsenate reductase (glutaredoxin) n=1 Tax=Mycetohabitans endofungorum TaxID=417203 RepID=UPI002B0615DE|nr:arsenate reductase (glutaredoxin) [Mycetohabitans endofungorum]